MQKNWKTQSEFSLCPQVKMEKHIEPYASNHIIGEVFSRNQYIEALATSADKNTLWVLCKTIDENPIKPWTMAEVTYESDLFTHTNLGSFFTKDGAEKKFTLLQGYCTGLNFNKIRKLLRKN